MNVDHARAGLTERQREIAENLEAHDAELARSVRLPRPYWLASSDPRAGRSCSPISGGIS